jgi:hypothetical protein
MDSPKDCKDWITVDALNEVVENFETVTAFISDKHKEYHLQYHPFQKIWISTVQLLLLIWFLKAPTTPPDWPR